MKVILLQEIHKLGKAGEVKNVREGYARNFLIPKKLVLPATETNLRRQKEVLHAEAGREEKERARFKALAEKLSKTTLHFLLKVGEKSQAFGSITSQDIVAELAKHSISVEKQWIGLEESIKTIGEHIVKIKLPHQIAAEFKIIVEPHT